jgi:hypothetical protein
MLSFTEKTSSLVANLLSSDLLGYVVLVRSVGSSLIELLRVEGTMFWKRLRFFLQFSAIYRLMLTCILRLKDATPRIVLNYSKCSLNC